MGERTFYLFAQGKFSSVNLNKLIFLPENSMPDSSSYV